MMSLGLLFSLFYSISSSSHTSAFFCVWFIFGQASFTLAPRTESNAYHIHFFPVALSGKTTSVFRTEVTAEVPELPFTGTGWFTCSFLNQSPWPGRWVWCSYRARVVDTCPGAGRWRWGSSWTTVTERDGEFYYRKGQWTLGRSRQWLSTVISFGQVGLRGPPWGDPCLPADALRWFLPVWFPVKYLSCWYGPPAILLLDIGRACRDYLINVDLI